MAFAAAVFTGVVLAGCGTSTQPPSAPPTGGLQPQSQPPGGPILGYAWDASSQALRPVKGIPGASVLGGAIVSAPGQGANFIASASSGVSGTALFLDANGGVFQSVLSQGKLSQVASLPGASGLALSSSGAYALVTGKDASGAGIAAVISGLPQTPSTRKLNLTASGAVLGGAASDTGTVAVATGSSETGVAVSAFVGLSAASTIASLQAFGGMQFVPGSDELVLADGESGALTSVSKVNTAPVVATLSPAGAIAAPIGLDVTPNGRWVVAANHAGDVLRIDLSGAAASARAHCACAPTQVVAMNGSTAGTTARLITAGSGPLWILDASAATPKVQFIPAAMAASAPSVVTKSAM